MNERPPLTPALREGRRALDGVPDIELDGDLTWDPLVRMWILPLRLRSEVPHGSTLPEWTRWYVHLHPRYPFGDIGVLPSKVDGIEETHPHQRLNRRGSDERPWRKGSLCLQTWRASLGRGGTRPTSSAPG
jgi:hypothetical protein